MLSNRRYSKIAASIKKHKGVGHRERLRKRFLQGGLEAFLDYEIIELLLTLGTPFKDCKDMAKEAIKKLGGLQKVLDASPEELQKIKGIGPNNILGIKLFQAISERYSKGQVPQKNSLNSSEAVAKYLQKNIGREKKEHFVILFLDSRNNLIKKNISIGSINSSIVHPREVFKEAIEVSAAQIIIGHNHPSGDSEPSPDDVAVTRRLEDASKIVGIQLLDHVIVTTRDFSSMREKGLMF
ncbi:MAG: DNA repair protein RadC [Patescibacteria group bacterium]